MPSVLYTPDAKQDLSKIAWYIGRDNLPAALRWTDAIQGVCDLLATQPDLGLRVRSARFGDVRRHATGNYVIYYRPVESGIEVIRVLYGFRDQNTLT